MDTRNLFSQPTVATGRGEATDLALSFTAFSQDKLSELAHRVWSQADRPLVCLQLAPLLGDPVNPR